MKVKTVIIGIVLLILISLIINVQRIKISKLEADNMRLEYNQLQLNDTITNLTVLTLKKDEVIGKYARQRDSLSEALQIKPKQVLKIINTTITIHDTIPVPVFVNKIKKDEWLIVDTLPCGLWKGIANLDTLFNLNVKRIDYFSQNKTTDAFYKNAKFLFKKWKFIRLSKWEYKRKITSECDPDPVVEDITFIK